MIKNGLINEKHRYSMLQIATKEYKELEVSNIELNQEKKLSILEAFKKIEEKFKEVDKFYILGADNLYKMLKSEDLITLLENYNYIIVRRNEIDIEELIAGNEILQENKDKFKIMDNLKHNNTSSTIARRNLLEDYAKNEEILHKNVIEYIQKNTLYM